MSQGDGTGTGPARSRRQASPSLALWLRLGAAHFAAYPIAFAAAMAGVPLAMLVYGDAVLHAPSEQAAQRIIVEVCLSFAGVVYVVVHVVAVPWACGAAALARRAPDGPDRARRGRTTFLVAVLGMTAACVVGGLIGWVWLLAS